MTSRWLPDIFPLAQKSHPQDSHSAKKASKDGLGILPRTDAEIFGQLPLPALIHAPRQPVAHGS